MFKIRKTKDNFEHLRNELLYLIPDFHMRLKIEPESQKKSSLPTFTLCLILRGIRLPVCS